MRRYGERGLLVDTDRPLVLAAAVRRQGGVVDVVPGAASVLVVFADPAQRQRFVLPEVLDEPVAEPPHVQLEVSYDGPDLEYVADAAGLCVPDLVALHTGTSYVVALVGFVPGFAYLSGTPGPLHLPRRTSPRTAVPAGSLADAAGWTGIYPRPSPGGWHLLGRTDEALWDLQRDPPALLQPGTRVTLVAR